MKKQRKKRVRTQKGRASILLHLDVRLLKRLDTYVNELNCGTDSFLVMGPRVSRVETIRELLDEALLKKDF